MLLGITLELYLRAALCLGENSLIWASSLISSIISIVHLTPISFVFVLQEIRVSILRYLKTYYVIKKLGVILKWMGAGTWKQIAVSLVVSVELTFFHKIVTAPGWGVDFDGKHGVCAVHHSKRSFLGCWMWGGVVGPEHLFFSKDILIQSEKSESTQYFLNIKILMNVVIVTNYGAYLI